MSSAPSLAGQRVLVMGLGQFGGGVGVAKFLAAQGARVLVTDKERPEKLEQSKAQLAGLDIDFRLGEHIPSDFTTADLIVVNPAVIPYKSEHLLAAKNAGVPFTSEIRLLTQRLPNRHRIIGITGSAGKSTTTSMVGHILRTRQSSEFRVPSSELTTPKTTPTDSASPTRNSELETRNFPSVHLGGNLGGSLLNSLDTIRPDDWVVLELSSFMLEGLREDRFAPHIALITNLAPNHLDWHGTLEAYRDAKQALLDFQHDDDITILGPGADGFTPRVANKNQRVFLNADIAKLTRDVPPLLIPGEHNRLNAAMAVEVCVAAGVERSQALAAIATFTGLPHRLERVHEAHGVLYFNDSKCTTPQAAMLALQSFKPGIVHLILGGYNKGSDLAPLAAFAKQHCKAIHTIGTTGPAIADAAEKASGKALVFRSETLARAMHDMKPHLAPGDVALLSPACASWDQFTNFEARGAAFIELARSS